MPMNELEMFLSAWDREAESTLKALAGVARRRSTTFDPMPAVDRWASSRGTSRKVTRT